MRLNCVDAYLIVNTRQRLAIYFSYVSMLVNFNQALFWNWSNWKILYLLNIIISFTEVAKDKFIAYSWVLKEIFIIVNHLIPNIKNPNKNFYLSLKEFDY